MVGKTPSLEDLFEARVLVNMSEKSSSKDGVLMDKERHQEFRVSQKGLLYLRLFRKESL
ncbi:MAG: hypothetical protein ACKVOH_05700 [Chlamydiales bacterium]